MTRPFLVLAVLAAALPTACAAPDTVPPPRIDPPWNATGGDLAVPAADAAAAAGGSLRGLRSVETYRRHPLPGAAGGGAGCGVSFTAWFDPPPGAAGATMLGTSLEFRERGGGLVWEIAVAPRLVSLLGGHPTSRPLDLAGARVQTGKFDSAGIVSASRSCGPDRRCIAFADASARLLEGLALDEVTLTVSLADSPARVLPLRLRRAGGDAVSELAECVATLGPPPRPAPPEPPTRV